MRLLCFEYKVVSTEYFLDRMQMYEVNIYVEDIPYLDRNSWEQCRTRMYGLSQMFSKKELKPTDLLKFKWDEAEENNKTGISDEDIKRLTELSKKYEQH